ncbi:beta-lactamase/transpeptidase-like protein [Athelia psychrophila]|uniref:Beta-lactamase/transpeptidase-like protein n=1 Tax=Athelia psychrophila TaxID=1759441 RepID=A0A167XB03_9AGAM|nr:beta-lactamase/transpeptidase-like protein [Fibularhizoctonia sp. CBS 109695]
MRFYAIALLYLRSAALAQDTQVPLQADHKHSAVFTPEISKYIEEALDTYQVPGLSAAVIRKDGTVEVGAWGKSAEDGNRTTPDTLYYIASCSKAFTAAAMGILIGDFEQGRNTTALPADVTALNWNTKVKDLLPTEWALQDEWASEKASIRDIMAHVSGLGRHDLSYSPSLTSSDFRPPPADTDTNTAPIESAPPIDVHRYSGTYSHPAYGNLTFCGPHTLSDYCHKTRADFAPFPLGALPQLFATWPRFFASHVRVIFTDENSPSVEISTLFPDGYGADESPFTYVMYAGETGSEFSMDGGEVTRFQLKTADGSGDAWFEKI